MPLIKCSICLKSRGLFNPLCSDCQTLFKLVQANLGKTGLGQLIDVLLTIGIDKSHVKLFLENNPHGKGSILDQITAQLTNNLAEGIGVKECDMTAQDVQRLRQGPMTSATHKPIDS